MRICTLASGSSGNCLYIGTKEANILIDGGISCKRINERLEAQIGINAGDIDGILVTHEHTDHIQGLEVLAKRFNTPIYATCGTWQGINKRCNIDPNLSIAIGNNQSLHIKDFNIEAFPTPHDAQDPIGFLINAEEKTIGIATDLGMLPSRIKNTLRNADALILEANYDEGMLRSGLYPSFLKKRILGPNGHLSNEVAGQGLLDIIGERTQKVILAHLSQENNLPSLARKTVEEILKDNRIEHSFDLEVAPRSQSGTCINI